MWRSQTRSKASSVAAGEPDLVLVAVLAGHVDGGAPAVGGSAVAQPHQRQLFAVGEFAGDVGELAVIAHVHGGQLRPVLAWRARAAAVPGRSWWTRGSRAWVTSCPSRRVARRAAARDPAWSTVHVRIIDLKAARARLPRPPDHADRRRTASAQSPGLLPYRRLPAGHPRPDRARRRPAATPTRRSPAAGRCTSTPCAAGAAGTPTRAWPGWPTGAGPGGHPGSPRCRSPRSRRWPANCRPRPGCRCRRWSCPDLAARGRRPRHRPSDLGLHDPPDPGRRRAQALAAPVLDLHPRPRLRRQGHPGAGPLRPQLGRQAARRGRVRHLQRREDLHPGPLPLPPHPAPGQGPHDAGQPRIRPRRRPGLPGRLRRPPRPRVRPLRRPHRHRPVHRPWSTRS